MTAWQKTVKYIAIALAALLALGIIAGIAKGILYLVRGDGVLDEMRTHEIGKVEEISSLDIEVSAAELTIQTGESFSVKSNLKYLTVNTKGVTLVLEETSKFYIPSKKTPKVELVIPQNTEFDEVEIKTGAGKFVLNELFAKRLSFEFGAGSVEIQNLTATEEAEIEGGVGEINLLSGSLKNLDFDMGVGKLNVTAVLQGKSQLNCGVGEANVTLLGNQEDYTVNVEKSIGQAWIEAQKVENNTTYGIGENKVEVSGGVGSVWITFKEKTE